MKLKYLATIVLVLLGILLGIVYYYDVSPTLLTKLSFYQSLANPSVRIIRVQEGLRKEEVAEILTNQLNWDEEEKNDFLNIHLALNESNLEGRYFPKTYFIDKDENPLNVGTAMVDEFSKQTKKDKVRRNNK